MFAEETNILYKRLRNTHTYLITYLLIRLHKFAMCVGMRKKCLIGR